MGSAMFYAIRGSGFVFHKKWISALGFWVICLVMFLASGNVGALEIAVHEPSVYEGDSITHDGSTLKLEGEILGGTEIQEVTINGRSAAMATRDLMVEELEEEGFPFRGVVQLEGGDNAVEIKAVDDGGETVTLSFTVQVDPGVLNGEVYALVVAVNDYQDGRISDLRFAEPDAQAIEEVLTDPQHGIVKPENIVVLTGAQATYRNISKALEEHLVRKAKRAQDVVLFYFAGHGAEGPHISRGAAYYLVPHDAEVTNLLSTAIDKGRLQFLWGAIGAQRKIFITDACHSGGMQNMKVLSADGFETVEGFVTLTAARADQLALELPRLGHGLFTHALVEGMRGAGDGNGDGYVSAEELGAYITSQVQKMAAEMGAEQVPVVDIVPGAAGTPLATSGGKPLPMWKPVDPPAPAPYVGLIKVTMRFDAAEKEPYMLVAIRDEEGDEDVEEVAATAIMERFMSKRAPFRFVEPGAVEGKLEGDQYELAFSDNPADIAAVARAVEADLILTGHFTTEDTGMADEDMKELLGTTIQSYQAHLNARVIYANSGEIIQAKTVQTAATHLNPTMAQRQALEKACQKLSDVFRRTLKKKWDVLMAERPSGMIVAENVDDYQKLGRLEEALAGLEPMVTVLSWQSFEGNSAVFSFNATGGAERAAALLKEKGLAGFKVGGVKASEGAVSFWLK